MNNLGFGNMNTGFGGNNGQMQPMPQMPQVGGPRPVSSNPYLGQSNPYLQQNIDSTLGDITRNYNMAVKPQTESAMASSGSFGNSGLQQMQGEQQRNLAQQLGNTAGNMRQQDYQQQQAMYLGQGNLDVANRNADQSYNLGMGNLGLGYSGLNNQYNIAGLNNATTMRGQDQSYNLGQGNLALGNRTADQSYNLGMGNLGVAQQNAGTNQQSVNNSFTLGQQQNDISRLNANNTFALGQGQLQNQAQSTANQYDLGLRSSDLGFGQLDANINQQNFNNQLSGAKFGMDVYDRLNTNNANGITAGTTIQNTPYNYFGGFSGLANNVGGIGGSASTQMPGNPWLGALGGAQLGANIANLWK